MDETIAAVATEIAETVPEIMETVGETASAVYETVAETIAETVAEATISLTEELSPLYDALVTQNNLLVICICAAGLCAGVLLGVALWRWLK